MIEEDDGSESDDFIVGKIVVKKVIIFLFIKLMLLFEFIVVKVENMKFILINGKVLNVC